MGEVETMFKDNWGPCECGLEACGLSGTLRKPWRNGLRCVRGCPCPHCLGKRSRQKGDGKARVARKALNITGVNSRHEELVGGLVRWEAKAGAQVRPMWTAYTKAEAQSERARPIGDNRPFVFTAAPDDSSDQLISFRMSKVVDTVTALAQQLGIME